VKLVNKLLLLNIIQTGLLLLITAGTFYIVFHSFRSARGTRMSLRSRRREVYGNIVEMLTVLCQTGELRKEELMDFRSRTMDASLLFDADVAAYIDEIYARGVKLMSSHELLKGTALPIGEERDRITVENARQTIWLADQLALIGKKFDRYPDVK
jgi:hypothetical protein